MHNIVGLPFFRRREGETHIFFFYKHVIVRLTGRKTPSGCQANLGFECRKIQGPYYPTGSSTGNTSPYSETVVLLNTGKRGPVLLEASDERYRRKKVALVNGVAQVKPDVAFPVRVANMSSKEVILQKHEKIGTAVPLSTAANVDMVNNQTDQNADQTDGDTILPTDLDNLELDHLSADLQTRVREFLSPFSELWSGQLGTVRLTEHRIKLKPESEPVFSQPYSL